MTDGVRDRAYLRRAVRLAVRGHGGAEPNPMVGCLLVAADGTVVAEGYHRRCGEGHAEANALARAGGRARGATAYVTLEPCAHHGRTPPCADALVTAGVARVVYATPDPNPIARGGAERLRSAGIAAVHVPCPEADALNAPFLHRVRTGLPWVTAKWAQSLDGKIATRTGQSAWISSERSRRMVHRERGRVDAIMVGFQTARHDDPRLTARNVRRRRTAARVVVDPHGELPRTLHVFDDAAPTIVIAKPDVALRLRGEGRLAVALGADGSYRPALAALARDHGISTLLVEGGGGLLGSLVREHLVNEAFVFVAPIVLGDEDAIDPVRGLTPLSIADATRFVPSPPRQRGVDTLLQVRKAEGSGFGVRGKDRP
ncbi:MAG: bifunctional diaminohydroxyphosphoribosylaminopyrimidine deaminase/5-amino-6-(5-phosphoribosylamino)uracil reductase RibD [Phycisphaerae bacterium]|nr:bifunctional diaminohydroxyphosphoribosylaminopyrimidine deaminase/5-amino-6-(5-phosphoribosylamino)uracil reductase RibD [Phycisphaerae bacterium]